MDSGADLTLMHESLYKKLPHNVQRLQKGDIPTVASYSDHSIKILGTFQCMIKLNPTHKDGLVINIHVIADIPNQIPLLLGCNVLRIGCGELKF